LTYDADGNENEEQRIDFVIDGPVTFHQLIDGVNRRYWDHMQLREIYDIEYVVGVNLVSKLSERLDINTYYLYIKSY
jgi:hypothetical protein